MYKDAYEGLGRVMCYTTVAYTGDHSKATVSAKCRVHDSITKTEYNWNNEGYFPDSTYSADTGMTDDLTLTIKVTDKDGKEFTITAEPTNFVWQHPAVPQSSNYENG